MTVCSHSHYGTVASTSMPLRSVSHVAKADQDEKGRPTIYLPSEIHQAWPNHGGSRRGAARDRQHQNGRAKTSRANMPRHAKHVGDAAQGWAGGPESNKTQKEASVAAKPSASGSFVRRTCCVPGNSRPLRRMRTKTNEDYSR